MHINEMTREEFRRLPYIKWDEERTFNSLVIVPDVVPVLSILAYKLRCWLASRFKLESPNIYTVSGMHDSGYRCMSFAAVVDGEAEFLMGGCSDVLNLDGIGGYGKNWTNRIPTGIPLSISVAGWSVDCLAKSGFLHLFNSSGRMMNGASLSNFSIYHVKGDE